MHFLEEELRVKEGHIKLQFYGLTWLGGTGSFEYGNRLLGFIKHGKLHDLFVE
jgi:hypothetical protein